METSLGEENIPSERRVNYTSNAWWKKNHRQLIRNATNNTKTSVHNNGAFEGKEAAVNGVEARSRDSW